MRCTFLPLDEKRDVRGKKERGSSEGEVPFGGVGRLGVKRGEEKNRGK